MTFNIYKYPRTYHLEGSGVPSKSKRIPFSAIANRHLIVEEKMDGTNVGISFSPKGQILLQSRGHYLTQGVREKHFSLFKQWAYNLSEELLSVLGTRYILYGEWLYAKHTVFYNHLPHYFLEYDVLDLDKQEFLDTPLRQQLLKDLPIVSVPVLYNGKLNKYRKLKQFIGISNYIKEAHIENLKVLSQQLKLNLEVTIRETDNSNLMEGLYIKVEENGRVEERYKYIRGEFLNTIARSQGHWLDRPIIRNQLQPGVKL